MESLLEISFTDCSPARRDIYLVSVHCHSACNLVVWQADSNPSEKEMVELKKYVARLMDRLADLMHDYQKFAPLVALIDMHKDSASWLQLMGDQDWHRGRFVLQAVRSFEGKSVEDAKKRWLGELASTEYSPRRITAQDFSSVLSEAVKNAKPPRGVEPQLFTRFTDILKVSVDNGENDSVAQSWQDELVKDINDLLGKPVLEVASLG